MSVTEDGTSASAAHAGEGEQESKQAHDVANQASLRTIVGRLIFSDYYSSRDQSVAVLGGIGCGAVVGVLTRNRLGVWLASAAAVPGATGRAGVVVSHLFPNMFGCFVMGAVVAFRPWLQPPHPTIYAGLTTGFCGCCTTFSSYNTAVAMLLLRSGDPGEGILCAAVALYLGASTAWVSLHLGMLLLQRPKSAVAQRARSAQVKLEKVLVAPEKSTPVEVASIISDLTAVVDELPSLAPASEQLTSALPELPGKWIQQKKCVYWTALFVSLCIVIVCLCIDIDQISSLLVSAVLAPFGAWLRYGLGMRNAGHRIPFYTLLANLVAAALSALLALLLDTSCDRPMVTDSRWRVVLSGVSTGFCGSLSTVSSFVDEVRRLGEVCRRWPFAYVAATLLGGQLLALLVLVPAYASTDGCDIWGM